MKKKSIEKRLYEVADLALHAFNEQDNHEKVGEIYHALKDLREDLKETMETAESMRSAYDKNPYATTTQVILNNGRVFDFINTKIGHETEYDREMGRV